MMTIFHFLGMAYTILGVCVFTFLISWLVYQGLYRVGERVLRGREFEEKALKDYLPGIQVRQ